MKTKDCIASGVATDFRVGGRGHDLKTYLPTPNIALLISLTYRLHKFYTSPKKTRYLRGGQGLGLKHMHDKRARINVHLLDEAELSRLTHI